MFGLVGHNISYTFSPLIHNLLGYDYSVFDLNEAELHEFMLAKNFKGINVTIPYKQHIIQYLDVIDESAKQLNVVNTIINVNGKLIGYNTDTRGFEFSLKHHKVKISGKSVAILGTGSTSNSTKDIISRYNPKSIVQVGRSSEYNYDNLQLIEHSEIIINTTPVGVYPNIDECPIQLEMFNKLETLIDVIYNPLRTKLIAYGVNEKINSFGGLMMLVAQAVYSSEYFFNKHIDESVIVEIYNEIISIKENIVLIGMPTAGKTSIAKQLAKIINRKYIDIDEEIVKREGRPISQIFATDGESYFRNIEHEVIKTVSLDQQLVIATGGGSILNIDNVNLLKRNGKVIFIDRSLENLSSSADRPLNSNADQLKKLYTERIHLYNEYCDNKVHNNSTFEHVISKIIEVTK